VSDHELIDQGGSESFTPTPEQAAELAEAASAKAAAARTAGAIEGAPDFVDSKFHVAKEDGSIDMEATMRKQADSYKSLQAEFTKRNQAASEPDALDQDAQDALSQAAEQAPADSPLGQALAEATAAYEGDGMTEEHFQSLVDNGIPREYIDQYIDNFEAGQAQFDSDIYAITGGEEAYNNLLQWAGSNLTEGEITAFDNGVTSGDPAQAKLVTQALQARFEAAGGRQGADFAGGSDHTMGGGFSDLSEQLAAQNDPRYKTSEAFRQEVARRIAASNY
jgi:hypothetical protein